MLKKNKHKIERSSSTVSLFYIFRYPFALEKRYKNNSFLTGVSRTIAKCNMELSVTKVNGFCAVWDIV